MKIAYKEAFEVIGMFAVALVAVFSMVFTAITITSWLFPDPWQEKWECVEWEGKYENITIEDKIFFERYLHFEKIKCNYEWDCMWESGLVPNNTKINIIDWSWRPGEWMIERCEVNQTEPIFCHTIFEQRFNDSNCIKMDDVKVRT